jgi:hypothetical protein
VIIAARYDGRTTGGDPTIGAGYRCHRQGVESDSLHVLVSFD